MVIVHSVETSNITCGGKFVGGKLILCGAHTVLYPSSDTVCMYVCMYNLTLRLPD